MENQIEVGITIVPLDETELMNIKFQEVFWRSENPQAV